MFHIATTLPFGDHFLLEITSAPQALVASAPSTKQVHDTRAIRLKTTEGFLILYAKYTRGRRHCVIPDTASSNHVNATPIINPTLNILLA
jgi:hypothetical protein